jgi:hypothetical protein
MRPALKYKIVSQSLKVYEEEEETWNKRHDDAMLCRDLEDIVSLSIKLYCEIIELDEDVRLCEFDDRDSEIRLLVKTNELLQRWVQTSGDVLESISRMERGGYSIDGSDRFRGFLKEAENILTDDSKFFTGPKLQKMESEAILTHNDGKTEVF